MTTAFQPYVSVDLETTGLNPEQCQILEIGAVIDTGLDIPIEELPSIRMLISHDTMKGEPFALQMNQKIILEIAQRKSPDLVQLGNVVPNFLAFLAKHGIDTAKGFQPAGKNFASFDKPFLETCIPNWKRDVKIKHRTIDPGNLFWWPTEEYIPDTKTCYERAGLDPTVAHTAVEDARGVVALVRAWVKQRKTEARAARHGGDFTEAFGYLQARLHPGLVVDANNPMQMARDVAAFVQGQAVPA